MLEITAGDTCYFDVIVNNDPTLDLTKAQTITWKLTRGNIELTGLGVAKDIATLTVKLESNQTATLEGIFELRAKVTDDFGDDATVLRDYEVKFVK